MHSTATAKTTLASPPTLTSAHSSTSSLPTVNPTQPSPRKRGRPPRNPQQPPPPPPALNLDEVVPPFLPENYDTSDRKHRHFGLKTAPTFRPTPAEWSDPLSYIEKIRLVGERTGIVKIIPPGEWKPDFAMDTEKFRFSTRIQKLNSMEGSTRTVVNYLDQLEQFHQQQGSSFTRVPMLDKKPLDLHQLKKEVAARGGYDGVTRGKKWSEVGKILGADPKSTSGFYTCRNAYMKWIHPFEEYLASMGKSEPEPAPFYDQNAHTPQPEIKPPPVSAHKSRMSSNSPPKSAQDEDMGVRASESTPESTDSPAPRKRGRPKKKSDESSQKVPKKTSGVEFDGCELCGSMKNEDRILLCDSCDRGFHLDCLVPPLSAVPQTDEWFCPDCMRSYGVDFGFEDGGDYTLSEFHRFAADFKEKWFTDKGMKGEDGRLRVAEDDVEKEFWRLVESPYDEIEVEYGADLHSTQHGSGFPVAEKQPRNPYSTCGWNLNNIPVLADSLFCHIRNDISGIMIPWLYVGMVFSTFCWHTEDHYTYSVNYLHWGETKTWYGVPAAHAERFEEAMRRRVPELFEATPDLLFHLTTMLSPGVLQENFVDVFALDQRAGEFVITFPKAFHAGFNHGFNFAEAVNFALPNWLPYGLSCISKYREFHKQPVFSHDELIIATLRKDTTIRTAMWLQEELNQLEQRERIGRQRVRELFPNIKEVVEDCKLSTEDEDLQCAVCRTFCYVSCVICDCNRTRPLCLFHFERIRELCPCEEKENKLTLWMRFSQSELAEMTQMSRKIANRPLEWKERYRLLMLSYRRPPLKEMQKLLATAEKIPCFIDEAITLRAFTDKAADWVSRAGKFLSHVTRRRSIKGDGEVEFYVDEGFSQDLLEDELLAEAGEMPFDSPEIGALRKLAEDWQGRRDAAVELLMMEANDVKVEALEKFLVEVSESVGGRESAGYRLPFIKEVNLIVGAHKDLKWIEKGEAVLKTFEGKAQRMESDDERVAGEGPEGFMEMLEEVIRDGRRPHSVASVENEYAISAFLRRKRTHLVTELKKIREMGDKWKLGVVALYKQKTISFTELRQAHVDALHLFVDESMFSKVAKHVAVAEAWIAKVKPILTAIAPPSVESEEPTPAVVSSDFPKMTVAEAKLVIDDLDNTIDAPLVIEEREQLERALRRVEEWTLKGRKIFGFNSVRTTQSLGSILDENLAQAKICAGLEATGIPLHCICRSASEDGLMIECDSCNVWYHTPCVRVTKKEAKAQTSYLCLVCDPAYAVASTSAKRAHFNQIASFLDEVSELPFVPYDYTTLKNLVTVLNNWLAILKTTVGHLESEKEPCGVTIEEVRGLVRCLEGFAISMEDGILEKMRKLMWERFPFKAVPVKDKTSEPMSEDVEDEDAHDGTYSKKSTAPSPAKEIFCICKSKYDDDRPMIACDTCEDWFHFSCVNLSAGEAEAIQSYQCPICKSGKGSNMDAEKAAKGLPRLTLKLPKLDAMANKRKDGSSQNTPRKKTKSGEPSKSSGKKKDFTPQPPTSAPPSAFPLPGIPIPGRTPAELNRNVFMQPYQNPLMTPETASMWPSHIYGTWIVMPNGMKPGSSDPNAMVPPPMTLDRNFTTFMHSFGIPQSTSQPVPNPP